ncbi:unnamed protein product [Adineta steineri]|uniref:Uncharacterized protein n=1 Tax=Adineta steineri TaxID=433720 RepID=A0A818JGE8_9BILA|nr:unnamed protein product [Adineta steineri]
MAQPFPSNVPGAYNPQMNGQPQYNGQPPRPMHPQQNGPYPPPQISNHSSPQMVNRPPPPQSQMMNRPPHPQMPNHPSGQMMNRPPPPPQMPGSHPSAQMMNRPPPPQMPGSHPSAQMMNRPPPPQMPGGHPSAQMMNRPPPPQMPGGHPSAQMMNRPPYPQMPGTHPSAQAMNRSPHPQMPNHPTGQIMNPSQMPPQPSHHPSAQLAGRRTSQLSQVPTQPGMFNGPNTGHPGPLTGTVINTNNPDIRNFEQSQVVSPVSNRLTPSGQHIPLPASNNISPFQQPQSGLPSSKFDGREVSSSIRTVSDDDALSIVSMNKKHLPVFARFPFDISFLSQPMNITGDNSIQDLRYRLIESDLNYQRRTTDEYIKRTRRIGMEGDPDSKLDIERELEIQKIQASLNSGRVSRQPVLLSDYSHVSRSQMKPINEILEDRRYASDNMDDLIDSMARRHLVDRGYDLSPERRQSGLGNYSPYIGSSPTGRRMLLRSQQRNDDIYFANTPPSNYFEHDGGRTPTNGLHHMLRSGSDPHQPSQLHYDDGGTNNIMHSDSSPKLPPILQGSDANRFNRPSYATNSTLYLARHNLQGYKNYQQSIPLGLPDHSEHLIELPSDIFLTSKREQDESPQRHRSLHRSKSRKVRRHKTVVSEDSESDASDDDDENNLFSDNNNNNHHHHHRRHRSKNRHEEEQGFFTERSLPKKTKKKNKRVRQLFRKAIIAVLFIKVLKRRAVKNHTKRSQQTLSATIHKIRLQEIMVALHRVYLEPEGPIYNALIQATSNTVDLRNALNASSKNYSNAIYVIGDAVKNIISRIVDFMPKDGVLGTSKNSAIAALIQNGHPFPDNYFWQCEKELLEFNKSKLTHITKQRAILLIIGSFIFRALVTTLLTKPIKYRLLLGQLTPTQSASLKVLASILFYVGRRAVKSSPQILALPHEWSYSLYNDASIKPIIQHSEIKPIITKCEQSLRVWCEQYIRRIDASFGKELRS